jgi:hypothetical protein
MTQAFVVSFRGALTADEVDVLERAGFRAHVRGMNTFEGLWPGEAPDDWESRHVVLLQAEDRADAERKVADVLNRELPGATTDQ